MTARKKWTLAGAARAAREARIATAAHLRTAEVARQWQMVKLVRAHQVHSAHLGHRDAATMFLFGGLGYRPPYPKDMRAAADMIVRDEARYLAEAELYVLTPDMCDVVVAAAQSLTLEDLQLVDADDLPSPTGLVILPYPLVIRNVGGELGDDRAFAWRSPATVSMPDPQHPDRLRTLPAVRLSAFHDTHGPIRPESFVQFSQEAHRLGTPLPPLLLDAIRCVPFRYTDGDPVDAAERLARAAKKIDGALRREAEAQGLDEDNVVEGEYTPGSTIDDPHDTFTTRFLYAFWRLCEQRLTNIEQADVNHSARLTAERAGVSPEVRVVRLRQADGVPRQAPAGARDWNHRWVVKMHRVRQWYPSEGKHKVIYRGPYVKGPADKPLLGGETVRALVR